MGGQDELSVGPQRLVLEGKCAEGRGPVVVTGADGEVFVAVPSPDGSVVFWDARSGKHQHLLMALGSRTASIVAAGRSESATRIATSHAEDRFRLWNPVTGEEIPTADVGPVEAIAFASGCGGQIRVIGASARQRTLWDGATGELLDEVETRDASRVLDAALAVSADGIVVFAIEKLRLVDGWFSSEIEWGEWAACGVHRSAGTEPVFVRGEAGRPTLAFHHYEKQSVAGGRAFVFSELQLRDATTGDAVCTPIPHSGLGAVCPVGRGNHDVVATADDSGLIRLVEPSTGDVLAVAESGDVLLALDVWPDGIIAAAGLDATIHVWDGANGLETIDLGLDWQLDTIAVASVDGTRIVVTADPLCLWNLTAVPQAATSAAQQTPVPSSDHLVELEERSLLGELDGRRVEAVFEERPGRDAVIRCVDVTDRSQVGRTIHGMPPAHQVGFARTLDGRSILVALTSDWLYAFDRLVPPDEGPIRAGATPNVLHADSFVTLDPVRADEIRVGLRSGGRVDVVDLQITNEMRSEAEDPPVDAPRSQPLPDARLPEKWLIGAPAGWLHQEGVPGFATGPARFAVTFTPVGPLRRTSSDVLSIEELDGGLYRVCGHLEPGRIRCGIDLVADEQLARAEKPAPDDLMVEGRVSLHIGSETMISSNPKYAWIIEEVRSDGLLVCRLMDRASSSES